MTTETTISGWLLVIGPALFIIGALVVAWGRSAWAESRARKAEAIISAPVVDDLSPELRASFDQSLAIAKHTLDADRKLASVAPVIPLQRRGGSR